MIVRTIWEELLHPTSVNVIIYFLLHQCEASPPASRLSSSFGAVSVATATLLHMDVCVWNHLLIQALQINSAIAGARFLTAGARVLHSSCFFRVPEERRGRING